MDKPSETILKLNALQYAMQNRSTIETVSENIVKSFIAGYEFAQQFNKEPKVYCIPCKLDFNRIVKALKDENEFILYATELHLVYSLNEFARNFNNEEINPDWYILIR